MKHNISEVDMKNDPRVNPKTKWEGKIEIVTYDCPFCGCPILSGSHYCSNCGEAIITPEIA